jgi:tyrosinase
MANGGDVTNATREQAGDLKHRKRLSALTDDDVAALREAMRRFQAISDSRGYGHFASLHGFPEPGYCEHRNQLFLPWHRGYLYFFEQALQDVGVPGVTLPWWDWTESRDIPPAYADPTDPNGQANPLFDAEVVAAGGMRDPGWPERTSRPAQRDATWLAGGGLPTQDDVDRVLGAANFDDLTFELENIHNAVHVWVGGQMGDQRFAGWDPIFWAHHTMVDRLWGLWQLAHPGDNPRAEHLPKGLNYFKDMTVAQTLDFASLGYDYAATEILVTAEPGTDPIESEPFAAGPLADGFTRADVELHRVDQVTPSFEGRIFVNSPDAGGETPLDDDHGYLGSFYVFGKVECWGDEETHCDEPTPRKFDRRRPPNRYAKIRVRTRGEALQRAAADGGELTLRIVTVLPGDSDKKPEDALRFERMSVITYV